MPGVMTTTVGSARTVSSRRSGAWSRRLSRWPGADQPLTATEVSGDDGVLRFDYPSPGTHVVLTSRDNAVFVLLFDQVPEDPSYLAAVRG